MLHTRFASILLISSVLIGLLMLPAGADAAPGASADSQATSTTISSLPAGTYAGPAKPWVQVNDGAFGLGDPSNQNPPYSSEDGFEVTVFNDRLYVGMEGDNQYGARVWRTQAGVAIARSQADWEQVVDDAFGDVNNNDHIDSLQGLGGHIYASTAQSSYNSGTEVWRSSSGAPGSWAQANADGFGDFRNLNFKDMATFSVDGTAWLCGGTMNVTRGPQVWCTVDGETWELKNPSWRNLGDVGYIKIWSTGVMDGHLYVGTECSFNGPCPGAVWRTDGTADPSDASRWQWEKVFEATTNERVDIVGEYAGQMYIGFDGGNGTEVWRSTSGAASSWEQVNADGFGDPNNGRVVGDAGVVYNGALYLATLNQATGAQVWRTTDGTAWEQVGSFGDGNTFAAQLIEFNGYLYAWATNYQTGQQVLRTKAPICEQQAINGVGTYAYDGVGATLNFKAENLDSVEVCVYPNAFPEDQVGNKQLKRHYEINGTPAGGTFKVDVTLTYTDEEFAASGMGGGDTAYLVHNSGGQWAWCPSDRLTWDAANNAVTCADVTTFSTFAMAGASAPPQAVTGITITKAGSDIQLAWNPVTQDTNGNPLSSVQYRVYRKANDAYFTPTTNELIATVSGTSYTDAGAVGDAGNNYFYVVTAIDAGGVESALSSRPGKFVWTIQPGYNLLSVPLIMDDPSIQSVLGTQLAGGDSIATGDRVLKFDPVSQSYSEIAVYVDGTGTGYDGQWYDVQNFPNVVSAMRLNAHTGFWVQHRAADTRTVTIVGRVAEVGERLTTIHAGPYQIIGITYLQSLALGSSNLRESGATGGDSIATGDRILRFGPISQSYDAIAVLIDNTGTAYDGVWADAQNFPNPSSLSLDPGVGYWYNNREPATSFTWVYSN